MTGSLINVKDIYLDYEHLFSDKVKEAYAKPKINKFLPNTRYFAFRAVGEHNIPKGAEKIADIMNELANLGYIETFMSYFGCLELTDFVGLGSHEYAIYLWPILTPEGCAFVDAKSYDSVADAGCLSEAVISDPLT